MDWLTLAAFETFATFATPVAKATGRATESKFVKKALTLIGVALSFCASYRVNSYKSAAPKLFLIERVGGVGFFVVSRDSEILVQFPGEIAGQDMQRFLALPM